EPAPTDPRAARFGQLFARVFGEQTRQPVAGTPSDGQGGLAGPTAASSMAQDAEAQPNEAQGAKPASLRALTIGEGTEIITAGPPPADEDLLRYARDASMDEGSVAALLRHGRLVEWAGLASAAGRATSEESDSAAQAPGAEGELDGDDKADTVSKGAGGAKTDEAELSLLHTAQEALILKGHEGRVVARGADSLASSSTATTLSQGMTATLGLLANAASAARTAASVLPQVPTGPQSSEAGFSVSLATGTSVSEMPTSRWMQSRAGSVEGAGGVAGATGAPTEALDGTTDPAIEGVMKNAEIEPKAMGHAKFDFEALRLRLGLDDQSTKDRLMKILGPEAVRAAEAGLEPEAARLEAISLVDPLLDLPDMPSMPDRTIDGLLGESEGLATMMGGGSTASGQGGGEGARPDPNASGQAGQPRALPQQIMQRFGELLSQRLLQQVTQGNWRVELDLEPGDLGSIRIELELRKGEIEASIKATQASTRDLLQESLPRLKEALERNGMDVASLSVSQQDRRQSGGQSPSGRQSSGGQGSATEPLPESASGTDKRPAQDDGRLDVWV
ncbi:MAG: hypothetical protein RL258_1563, partial [Pseudomonadota bacterium]